MGIEGRLPLVEVKIHTEAAYTVVDHMNRHFVSTVGCNVEMDRYCHCACPLNKDLVCCNTVSL